MPDVDLSFLPHREDEREALAVLFSELINAGDDNLESLIVFGSAATGAFDPEKSDLNLVVLLRRDDRDVLDAIKPHLSALIRRFKVSPLVSTREELESSADVFPVKFLSIRERHRVLFGYDPFETMQIRRVHLRLRCEQELKNMAIRFRRALVSRAATPLARVDMIRNFLSGFTTVLRTMLTMVDQKPKEGRLEVIEQAALFFDLPKDQLSELAELGWGEGELPDNDRLEDLSHAFLKVVAAAAAVADRMPDSVDAEPESDAEP